MSNKIDKAKPVEPLTSKAPPADPKGLPPGNSAPSENTYGRDPRTIRMLKKVAETAAEGGRARVIIEGDMKVVGVLIRRYVLQALEAQAATTKNQELPDPEEVFKRILIEQSSALFGSDIDFGSMQEHNGRGRLFVIDWEILEKMCKPVISMYTAFNA